MSMQVNWRESTLSIESSIQNAISNLDKTGLRIVMVVDKAGRLLGTVSDGDIRRGLLRGVSLESSLDSIMSSNPLVVPQELELNAVMQIMRTNRIQQLPIVDEASHILVGLHIWDEIAAPLERKNIMVIMAGGLGTRLAPHTDSCPKPLLPLAGKPMLEHIIERARSEGFRHFVLSVRYLADMIKEYFGDGGRWNVHIEYLHENEPLGTAGALSLLAPRPGLPFIVTNGDVMTDIRYGELLNYHERVHAQATMAVRLYEWQSPFGVVRTNGVDFVSIEEKPTYSAHVNAGVYAFSPKSLDALQIGERTDMPALFDTLKLGGARTVVYPIHEPWLDVGRVDDYEAAGSMFNNAKNSDKESK